MLSMRYRQERFTAGRDQVEKVIKAHYRELILENGQLLSPFNLPW